jgi:A/G-specific adenine glycosylase
LNATFPPKAAGFRKKLAQWYKKNARDLPWRRTSDPYAIWISEIMLQQTRVAAAIPYYERFLERFPNAESLAAASETEVLTAWSGLGYYSRARNLHRAARAIADLGAFPGDYEAIRELPGVGDYTAAAVASIAFGLPHAVVDGNVKRVIARLTGDAHVDVQAIADRLLDRKHPARSNQALMELGALVCLPRDPQCGGCPVAGECVARKNGTQAQLPLKKPRQPPGRIRLTLLVIRRRGKILLTPSPRVRGFWDLPEGPPGASPGSALGTFRHSIMNSRYECEVREAVTDRAPDGARWWAEAKLHEIPLSTTAKKALRVIEQRPQNGPGPLRANDRLVAQSRD